MKQKIFFARNIDFLLISMRNQPLWVPSVLHTGVLYLTDSLTHSYTWSQCFALKLPLWNKCSNTKTKDTAKYKCCFSGTGTAWIEGSGRFRQFFWKKLPEPKKLFDSGRLSRRSFSIQAVFFQINCLNRPLFLIQAVLAWIVEVLRDSLPESWRFFEIVCLNQKEWTIQAVYLKKNCLNWKASSR